MCCSKIFFTGLNLTSQLYTLYGVSLNFSHVSQAKETLSETLQQGNSHFLTFIYNNRLFLANN